MNKRAWNIVADIGGTNARLAVSDPSSATLHHIRHYSVNDYAQLSDVIVNFLEQVFDIGDWRPFPAAACMAVACPEHDERIKFTNSSWYADRRKLSVLLRDIPVRVINDFAATGYAITDLGSDDYIEINAGVPKTGAPVVVLGPGTGLGVCTVVNTSTHCHVLAGEGGHVDFCAVDAMDIAVLEQLTARFGRVSAERVLSGSGIDNIYQALAVVSGQQRRLAGAAEITAAAIAGQDQLAVDTLQLFCRALGSVAGNLALTLDAKGGVYIAGGIVPRFIDFFRSSGFRHRFLAKGRLETYLCDIPVRLIIKENMGLLGAAKKLALSKWDDPERLPDDNSTLDPP